VVITSFNEPTTIGKAIEQIICPNKDLSSDLRLFITSPDGPTLKKAEEVCQSVGFTNFRLIQDAGQGKACAINLAIETITKYHVVSQEEDLLILTDGDMYVADDAIKNLLKAVASLACVETDSTKQSILGGVGGRPVSLDSRTTMFGYYSHLFCEAAHQKRLSANPTVDLIQDPDKNSVDALGQKVRHPTLKNKDMVSMSGYLYAIQPVEGIFPIPPEIRAEDAYISQKLADLGYKIAYAPDVLAYVKFPKNLGDWYKQKTRSLGGNVQVSTSVRSITQDLQMLFFPLLFAKSLKEFFWSLLLYPLRLFLWVRIYCNHALKRYKPGAWDRIESSK